MALKADLRKAALAHRRSLSSEEVNARSQQVADLFFATYAPKAGETVHTYVPIQRLCEISTWPIIQRIWQDYPGVQIAVPVAFEADLSLAHFLIDPDTQMVENKWGIPEPVGALPIPESEITTVLVPLLTFDLNGHRVGYGKGFYDRFLDLLPQTTQKIGLALEPPVNCIDDVHENDLTLDAVISPSQVWTFAEEEEEEDGQKENSDSDSEKEKS